MTPPATSVGPETWGPFNRKVNRLRIVYGTGVYVEVRRRFFGWAVIGYIGFAGPKVVIIRTHRWFLLDTSARSFANGLCHGHDDIGVAGG